MFELNKVYLLLGSNIEPRMDYLNEAEAYIKRDIGDILNSSNNYESEALGFSSDTSFINRVLELNSKLSEYDVLEKNLEIESKLGRIRMGKGYSSRTIDIDILYYNELVIDTNKLTLPHPRLHLRRFTLLPLVDVAPNYIHPLLNKDNKELLQVCEDDSQVNIYNC